MTTERARSHGVLAAGKRSAGAEPGSPGGRRLPVPGEQRKAAVAVSSVATEFPRWALLVSSCWPDDFLGLAWQDGIA